MNNTYTPVGMKNTIECRGKPRDPYTQEQRIDTAIGICMILAFFIALAGA